MKIPALGLDKTLTYIVALEHLLYHCSSEHWLLSSYHSVSIELPISYPFESVAADVIG